MDEMLLNGEDRSKTYTDVRRTRTKAVKQQIAIFEGKINAPSWERALAYQKICFLSTEVTHKKFDRKIDYSTVTLFAKFLGRSGSNPRSTAM